jgi:hypothetical protein
MADSLYAEFLPEFDLYHMTASDVLAVKYSDCSLLLEINAALTPRHPNYSRPPSSYAHCWRKAQIRFENVRRINVTELDVWIQDVDDRDGPHLGEMWCIVEESDHLLLCAEFGCLQIWSDRPTIELIASTEPYNNE